MIEITSFPSGEEAIASIEELSTGSSYSNQKLRIKLNNNKEVFDVVRSILNGIVSNEGVESNVLNTLQNLESWMMHNRTIRGAHASYLALRIINTHLTLLFFQRHR